MIEWSGLNLSYVDGGSESCKELQVTVAHQGGAGQLWLTDICQQDIVVRDSISDEVLFRQRSHSVSQPGSCVTFWELASGVAAFDVVEDNGETLCNVRMTRPTFITSYAK